MIKLNKKEIALGAGFGLAFCWIIGAWGLLVAALSAILWSLGGSGKGKIFRVLGVPLSAGVFVGLSARSFVCGALAAAVLSIGYGIPSVNDEGSSLGRFFYYGIAKRSDSEATLWTRGTLALALGIAYLPLWRLPEWFGLVVTLVVLHLLAIRFIEGNLEIG